jgi:hypothetical protein
VSSACGTSSCWRDPIYTPCGKGGLNQSLLRAYELESRVAVAPRVIIDPEVFLLLEKYPSLCGHDVEEEMQYLRRLLRKDQDGVGFIDYLRAFESETDDQPTYLKFLKAYRQLIIDRLQQFKQLDSVLTKYGWLANYHNQCVNGLNEDAFKEFGTSKEKFLVEINATPFAARD